MLNTLISEQPAIYISSDEEPEDLQRGRAINRQQRNSQTALYENNLSNPIDLECEENTPPVTLAPKGNGTGISQSHAGKPDPLSNIVWKHSIFDTFSEMLSNPVEIIPSPSIPASHSAPTHSPKLIQHLPGSKESPISNFKPLINNVNAKQPKSVFFNTYLVV